MATSFSNSETPRTVVWTDVLGGNGPITRAKARAMEAVSQTVHAVDNASLTPIDHSTAAREPVKPRAVGKHLADRLAAKQARVEAQMKRLEAELEQTRARLDSLGSDSDSLSEQSLPRRHRSLHKNNDVSENTSSSPPTTIGGTQNNVGAINEPPSNGPMITRGELEQVKTELKDSFELLLANIQQVISTAVAEQIKVLTSDNQRNVVVSNVANPVTQTIRNEGQCVAPTSQTVTSGLDGLSAASAVPTVCSATIITAVVPTTSLASSRATSVVTTAGPCGPIMTVVNMNDSATSHSASKVTVNKAMVDHAVHSNDLPVASASNADQIQAKVQTKETVKVNAKLKPYAGGPGVEQYLAQFKMVAKLNRWPEDEWGTILATFLDDKARRLLPRDPSAEPPNFSELCKQLISRFGHEGQPSYFAALLQSVSRRDGQSIHELKNAVEEMAERAYPGMEPAERRRVCLEPFINALSNEEQRKNVRLARPKDIDEAAEIAVVFESALKTEARKKGTRAKEIKEIRAVTIDSGDDKTVEYIEPGRKQTNSNTKGSQQQKWKNKKESSGKIEQPRSDASMEARIDAMMNEMAAITATIQSLAVGANPVPNSQSRRWPPRGASNVRPRAGENQFGERVICFQCGLEGHYRRDCQAHRQGNERGRRQDGHGAGQFQ